MTKPLETPFSWTCPFCSSTTTINRNDFSSQQHFCNIKSKYGTKAVYTYLIICPNPDCKEYSLVADLFEAKLVTGVGWTIGEFENRWTIVPSYQAKMFPDYIPKPILDDYYEACQIRELSPKAAATLARRCMQGMIRDFWSIKGNRLIDEIKMLEDKVDPITWQAIDTIRKVGNIGAHMEKDVNLVVEIEPDEANLLLNLIEILLNEWYVNRYERQSRIEKIIEMGKNKTSKK